MKYKLNEPYLKGNEKKYVNEVIDSGWLSLKGKHVKIFEEKFAQMVGVKYALAVQSGTAALHTALLSLGIGKGDKVIIPNYTCGGCATSVIQCGAEPVIIDVEEETFCLDADIIEKYLREEKPKAIMLVHIYGFPARDLEKIINICKRENIYLLEDCSEAHGAEYYGKKVGSFGDIAVFSVRSEKMIGVGEGGLILTDSKELTEKAFYWASRASPYRRKKDPYWKNYYYSGIGMNYLMPHILGAIGRGQIENFDEILKRKRIVGRKYKELLKDFPQIKLQKIISEANPAFWLNILLFENKTKQEVINLGEKLIKEEVEIRPAFWPLGDQPIFNRYRYDKQDVANKIFKKGIVFPSSVFLADDNCKSVKEIIEILKSQMNQASNYY